MTETPTPPDNAPEIVKVLSYLSPGATAAGAVANVASDKVGEVQSVATRISSDILSVLVGISLVIISTVILLRRPIASAVGVAGPGKVTKAVAVAKKVTG